MVELNKIYNENCLETMKKIPDNFVDLIVADPPYYKIVKDDWDNQWKSIDEYLNWFENIIKEFFRILKTNGSFYLWMGIGKNKEHPIFDMIKNSENIGFIFQDWITWKKQKGYGNKNGYMFIREELIFFTKSEEYTFNIPYLNEIAKNHGRLKKDKINYKRCGNVWCDINEVSVGNLIHTERVNHPTQKPLMACDRIILTSTNENDLIYVPFVGSGSEIVSSFKNKRNYIGSEISNEYCELTLNRLNESNNKKDQSRSNNLKDFLKTS